MKKFNRMQAVAAALVMAVALAVPVAMAQSSGESAPQEQQKRMRGHRKHGGRAMGRIFSQLDLTDAQKAQMKQIRESRHQALLPLKQELRAKRQEIRQASQGGTFDEALARQKLTEIAPLKAKLMGEQFKLHQEMLAVLTPEQKAKFDQMREQFKSRWAERRARKAQKTL